MKKTILLFTLLSLLGKLTAFGRELFLAYYYGTSVTSDTYLMSMTIPVTLYGFISTGIISGYIPIYTNLCREKGRKEAGTFTNKALTFLLCVCGVLIGGYFLFSEQIIKIVASGFSEEAINLTIQFTNITVFAIFFSCITTVLTGYLQANNKVHATAIISVPANCCIILSIILSFILNNVYILPIGYVLSCVMQFLFLLFFAKKQEFSYRLCLGIKDKNVQSFIKSISVLALGSSVNQINALVDRMIASNIAVGGVSVFEYAKRVDDFLIGVFIFPICTVLFPKLAEANHNMDKFKKHLTDGIFSLTLILVPITAIVVMFAKPIVKFLFYRGAFGDEALKLTSGVVMFYAVGLMAVALRELLAKAFYSLSDTKTPMINAMIGMILNIGLNVVFAHWMGISGLALATSVAGIFTVALLTVSLRKKIGKIGIGIQGKKIFVIIICTIISSIVSYFAYNLLMKNIYEIIALGLSAIFFAIIYCCMLFVFKIVDIESVLQIIRKRRN